MLNQSFRQVFVTNSPALLANGATVENIGVGQVGIVDAKTYRGLTSPTYVKNKAIQFVQGTPNIQLPLMSGVPNENEYTKEIRGKRITNFRGKAAKRGRNQVITVGWSGDVTDTDTLFAKAGDQKFFYLTVTGPAIDKQFSRQGITRQYFIDGGCVDDCTDTCSNVIDTRPFAESIAKQINTDPNINRYVKASVQTLCSPALTDPTTVNCYRFEVGVCDTRDDVSTGIVQAQYPDFHVTRARTQGNLSIYEVIKDTNTLPAAVSNAGFVLIPDCATCPAGYTLHPSGFVYTVVRGDAGDNTARTAVVTDYSASSTGESVTRIHYEFGRSTYVVVVLAKDLVANGTDALVFQGEARNSCVITSPTTTAWTLVETLVRFPKTYRLTIGDSLCGTDRLADIQAAYPALEVTLVDATGECVHTYETTGYSQCVVEGCSLDTLVFTDPEPFEGAIWREQAVAALADGTTCLVGVRIEAAYVNRLTGEATYDYFPYESDTIHLQASTFDPNYNAAPSSCTNEWVVKEIQSFQHPAGFGSHIRKMEEISKSYALRERSWSPVVREIEGYSFQAVPDKYYDEYVLDFEFDYKVGGWSQQYKDSYSLSVFFPEGQGVNFENAVNSYISSVGIDLDPVKLTN